MTHDPTIPEQRTPTFGCQPHPRGNVYQGVYPDENERWLAKRMQSHRWDDAKGCWVPREERGT